MKKSILITAAILANCILLTVNCFSQGTAINTTGAAADNSAMLDIGGSDKGMLMPRLTTAERNAIQSPAGGLLIFNNDCGNINYFYNGAWYPLNNGLFNLPGAADTISGQYSVCQGQTSVPYSTAAISGSSNYFWYYSGTGASISGTSNAVTIDFSPTATSGVLTVAGISACGKGTVSPDFGITIAAPPASVSINANPGANVCPGTNVTFTASPVNGGASPSYQWKVNGVNAGTNSSVYSYTPANEDSIRCVMTSNANCVTGSPASSNTITISHYTVPTITGTIPGSRTGAGPVALEASASAGTINWYSTASGGSSLGTGATFNTPAICVTTTYYVDATDNGCISSPRVAVTATINKSFQIDNGCSLTNNLISYWKMEGNANDYYGSYNGTTTNVSYAAGNGKINQGGSYNGSTSWIEGSAEITGIYNAFTVSMWVKRNGAGLNWPRFFLNTRVNVSITLTESNDPSDGGTLFRMYKGGSPSGFSLPPGTLVNGQWTMLTFWWNGTTMKVYVNGTQTGSTVNLTAPVDGISSGIYWTMGGESQPHSGGGQASSFNGCIDEASIWSRALTQQEIDDLYNAGSGQTMQ